MKQELFDIVFTSSVVFTISSCCNLCERVCSCLLLMGWNGCRLVCLFAVAGGRAVPSGGARQKLTVTVSGSLSSDLLIMHGWEGWLRLFSEVWALVPPPSFTSLTSPAWHLFIYLLMGWKRVLFSQSRAKMRQVSSENHVFPLCTLCPPSCFSVFYVAFLFLYSYRDDRVVS